MNIERRLPSARLGATIIFGVALGEFALIGISHKQLPQPEVTPQKTPTVVFDHSHTSRNSYNPNRPVFVALGIEATPDIASMFPDQRPETVRDAVDHRH